MLERGAGITILLFSPTSNPILGPQNFRDRSSVCVCGDVIGGSFLLPDQLDVSIFLFFSFSPTPFQKNERSYASDRFWGTK